ANPEKQPARNSVRTPEGRTRLLASIRRGSLGFAGLAPHSGRSSVPFLLSLFWDRRCFLPTTRPLTRFPHSGQNYPDKQRSIRKTTCSVKSHSTQSSGNLLRTQAFGPNSAVCPPIPSSFPKNRTWLSLDLGRFQARFPSRDPRGSLAT